MFLSSEQRSAGLIKHHLADKEDMVGSVCFSISTKGRHFTKNLSRRQAFLLELFTLDNAFFVRRNPPENKLTKLYLPTRNLLMWSAGDLKGAPTLGQYRCRMPDLLAFGSDITATSSAFLPAIAEQDPMCAPTNHWLGIRKASAALTFPMLSQRFPLTSRCLVRHRVFANCLQTTTSLLNFK